jgi:hypothetical protein
MSVTIKNPTLSNLTLEKHFMKLINLKKDKMHIKKFKNIFLCFEYHYETILYRSLYIYE